jgi:hypothetical protein
VTNHDLVKKSHDSGTDDRRRIEILLARAKVSLLAAHAHAARALVLVVGARLPADTTLAIYCERQALPPSEARFVGWHAFAHMDLPVSVPAATAPEPAGRRNGARAERVLTRGLQWLRSQIDPLADPQLREEVEVELARATATLILLHVRHARRLAAALEPRISACSAIALYLERLDVAASLRAGVFALALAQSLGQRGALPSGLHVSELPEQDATVHGQASAPPILQS